MASAGRSQLLSFMDELIPTIRTALCDRLAILLVLLVLPHIYLFIFYCTTKFSTFLISVNSISEVRVSAGLAFSTLYKVHFLVSEFTFFKNINLQDQTINCHPIQSAGMQAIDEIIPTLLHALEDDETSDTALDGLKQILR